MESAYLDKNQELVEACRNHCRDAQFKLYQCYAKAMYNIALRIVKYEEEAQDVLQEAFLDAFLRIRDFRQETTFGLWLKQIVINKSINVIRKRKFEFQDINEIEIADEWHEDAEDSNLDVEQVKNAIAELPDGYRVVLTLYLIEGYDHEEIAHILKIKEGTSRTQYMRAKNKLKEILEKKGYYND